MSLLKEFEENVKVVTETLEYWQEIIDQQFISEEISTKKIKGILIKTTLSKGLKENAIRNVSVTIFHSSLLWKESYPEILMWLSRNMPQFKNQIEQCYANISKQLNTIFTTDPALHEVMLGGLRGEVGKLISKLRYCAKMARAEFEAKKIEPENERPKDTITLSVATKKYSVSKSTLRRAIKDGRLESYKDTTKSSNSPEIVSESEVAKHWPSQ